MKKIEKLLLSILVITILLTVVLSITVSADNYKIDTVNFTDATVNVDALNMRQGPSISMSVVTKLKKSSAVKVLGKTGEWYFVFDTVSGKVGCVNGEYITPVTNQSKNETKLPEGGSSTVDKPDVPLTGLSGDESIIFELVNAARQNANSGKLDYNKDLAKVAYDKAKDMVENNYFSHQSRIYGTPFEMIRSYGISFNAAAENIAGNQNVEKAFYSWMASDSHKASILNSEYDETGIGIYISPVYGKIIVQMFIKK